jgi:hypothetical protein
MRSTVLQPNSYRDIEVVRASLCKVLFINIDGIDIGWLGFSNVLIANFAKLFARLCVQSKKYSPQDTKEYFVFYHSTRVSIVIITTLHTAEYVIISNLLNSLILLKLE